MDDNELELDRSRVYEIGMQIVPILGDEGAEAYFTGIKDRIISFGGEIIQEGAPERIDLAYSMSQIRDNKKVTYNEAYFAWIKFEVDASYIKTLEAELLKDLSVIRSIVFKTVRQNTYIPRKSPRRRNNNRSDDVINEDDLIVPVIDPIIEEDEIEVEVPSILDKKLDELTANDA